MSREQTQLGTFKHSYIPQIRLMQSVCLVSFLCYSFMVQSSIFFLKKITHTNTISSDSAAMPITKPPKKFPKRKC